MTQIPIVGVVTAMWKRHELTDIVFGNLACLRDELRDVIDLRLAVAGSEGEASEALALRHGFAYVEEPNQPLGAKWNAALQVLRQEPVEGVCIVGSDDLLNAAYFRMVADALSKGEKLFGIDSFYVLDRASGRMLQWLGYPPPRDEEAIGLGRFIHREYIDALNWELWAESLNGSLDYSMCKKIMTLATLVNKDARFSFKRIADYEIMPVDIKCEEQIWPYESTALSSYGLRLIGNPDILMKKYYNNDIIDKIFLNNELKECVDDVFLPEWPFVDLGRKRADILESSVAKYTKAVVCGDKTKEYVPFLFRHNITFITSQDSPNDEEKSFIQYFSAAREKLSSSTSLWVVGTHYGGRSNAKHGVFGYEFGNVHVWRNIFRIYVVSASFGNSKIMKDLLDHGNVVICFEDMRKFYPALNNLNCIVVNNVVDGIVSALSIHDNEQLWTSYAQKART